MKIVVIIPTYNERENIALLMEALQGVFEKMSHDMHVLVVDDSSPDGTSDHARELMKKFSFLHLIVGEKKGLGDAYIRGMTHALNEMGAEAVMEMDADFSHDPQDIPRLVGELSQGADFVIGSRYVKGGSIPADWGLFRKANSFGGNFVARFVVGLYKVKDCTAGFRAIKASVIRDIDLTDLRVQGYAFQIALLHRARTNGATIREVPVHFVDRTRGETKLGLSDIVEFLTTVFWIRFRTSETFIKFGVVGFIGVFINLGFFTLFVNWGMSTFLASPLAIEISIVIGFLMNNYWTYAKRPDNQRLLKKALKFNLVSLISLTVSFAIFVLLSLMYPQVAPQIHQAIGIIPATIVNYALNSVWTFRILPSK